MRYIKNDTVWKEKWNAVKNICGVQYFESLQKNGRNFYQKKPSTINEEEEQILVIHEAEV